MSKRKIKQFIEDRIKHDGLVKSGIEGVQLFRVTEPIQCAPAVYEPAIIVILNGTKEGILDGQRFIYDSSKYLCCTMSMPIEAGTPTSSPDNPLLGIYISLNTRVMTELVIEIESSSSVIRKPTDGTKPKGLVLAKWSDSFSESLFRLMQLIDNATDIAILGESRLREFYYAVLKGEASGSIKRAFGVGNEIAKTIEYLSSRLNQNVTIDELTSYAGMSRAVLHRKFKQATAMSPIQFIKSMKLNSAAIRIASGLNVNQAAMEVGYVSSSQFSREFKRVYGQSPKQWTQSKQVFS